MPVAFHFGHQSVMEPPSTLVAAVVVITSVSLGYLAARASSDTKIQTVEPAQPEPDSDSESDDDVDVSALKPADDCKLVLVVRTDLGMSTGKIAAQCSHATLACFKTLKGKNPALLQRWARTGYPTTTLRFPDNGDALETLQLLQAQAQSLNLCARSIKDAGRTQIEAGSTTVLGVAGPSLLVEQLTEGLVGLE
ncbi:peptidyl-tRNA hydrolase 2 [Roridomyces roridus]|uniref:peptidyl-tRNA hydrolase n=1 Tax=Roridomyces roridus TaxID=1738132 RepID=A0AAD7BTZ9_9AGAR|nr:peptidyl-tRNA hydrolase 2 [Roridomyces roridus]